MNRVINPTPLGGGGGGLVPTIRATAPVGSIVTCDGQTKVVGAEGYVDFVVSAEPVNILPDGVQGLEYIESNGSAVITTGILSNSTNREYEIEYMPKSTGYIFTQYHPIFRSGIYQDSSTKASVEGTASAFTFSSKYNEKVEIKIEQTSSLSSIYRNGVLVGSIATDQNNTFDWPLTLLGRQRGVGESVDYKASGRLYRFSYVENGAVFANFIPCIYNSQVGMWDTVSNSFFGNQGTGSFIAGEPKEWVEYPTYIVTVNGTSKSVMVDKTALFSVNF